MTCMLHQTGLSLPQSLQNDGKTDSVVLIGN